jgi:integrase
VRVVGLRDRTILATLGHTACRAGSIAKLRLQDFQHDGEHHVLRFQENGGKSREIPVRLELQRDILAYLEAAGVEVENKNRPPFRSKVRKTKKLTANALSSKAIYEMVKRRLKAAKLPARLSPHSFRLTAITDLLTQGVSFESVQYLAGHSSPRTTRPHDRRQKKLTRNIVERISIESSYLTMLGQDHHHGKCCLHLL